MSIEFAAPTSVDIADEALDDIVTRMCESQGFCIVRKQVREFGFADLSKPTIETVTLQFSPGQVYVAFRAAWRAAREKFLHDLVAALAEKQVDCRFEEL
jgi:hypothetical protein